MVLRYKDIHAFDKNKTMKIIYSMYRAGEVSVHRACCERDTQRYSLGGGGTIYPGSRPAGVATRCSRMVTECLLTRSMLIKMYKFTILGYVPVYVLCIYSQSISCRRSLSLFSLWFCLTQQFYQKAWVWVICSDETSNQAKARTFQISLSLQSTYLFDFCMFAASICIVMVKFFLCISFDLQKERTKERKKEPFFSNRELLSTRKHWTISPSLVQAHHRHYRHIAFISFQLKIATPFRKFST